MYSVQIIGFAELKARLDGLPPRLQSSLREFFNVFVLRLSDQVRANIRANFSHILDARRVFREGRSLEDSVQAEILEDAGAVIGRVYIEDVPYARIQEEGGTTAPHIIQARIANMLRFEGPTGLVYVKSVNHPGSNIPARPYMSLALTQMRGQFEAGAREITEAAVANP